MHTKSNNNKKKPTRNPFTKLLQVYSICYWKVFFFSLNDEHFPNVWTLLCAFWIASCIASIVLPSTPNRLWLAGGCFAPVSPFSSAFHRNNRASTSVQHWILRRKRKVRPIQIIFQNAYTIKMESIFCPCKQITEDAE